MWYGYPLGGSVMGKNTAEDFLKYISIAKPKAVPIDDQGRLLPLEEVPIDLLPEEDLGVATGEDYKNNE